MVQTLTADRLAQLQDEAADFLLVDTRPAESYDAWHILGARNFTFGPEEELNGRLETFREFAGDADRIITICAKGISSATLAEQLEGKLEATVEAVEGGMKAWSGVYEPVEVDISTDRTTVVQIQRRAKGCLGYIIGCEATGQAVVVDATDDPEAYATAAGDAGFTIAGVIDTHVHADHISGGRQLAAEFDVPYYLSARAAGRDLAFEYTPLERNEVLEVGELELKALSTPGHTSEMISLLLEDRALLTADTLHVDSTGRTELEFGDDGGEKGARMLYESLHRTVLAEPEGVVVLPGHVSVSANGEFGHGEPGEPIMTTIRAARTGIEALTLEQEAFIDRLAAAGEKPANYEAILEINRGVRDADPDQRIELELGPNNCSA